MRRHRPERETVAPFDERLVARGARAGESLAVARPHPRTPAPPGTARQGPRRASSPWPDGWPSGSPTDTRSQGEIIPSRRRRPGGSTAAPQPVDSRPSPSGLAPRRCRQRGRRAPVPKPSPAPSRRPAAQCWRRRPRDLGPVLPPPHGRLFLIDRGLARLLGLAAIALGWLLRLLPVPTLGWETMKVESLIFDFHGRMRA